MAVLRRFFTPLPCQRDALDILCEGYMKIVLINLFNAAKYKAGKYQMVPTLANTFCKFVKQFSFIDRIRIYSLHPCLNKHLSIQSNRDWLSMSIFSDYSSSSEMHNNLTIDYYLALSSTKGSGITNIISIILQQAQDYDVAKIT